MSTGQDLLAAARVIIRDRSPGARCEMCGRAPGTEASHRVPRGMGGPGSKAEPAAHSPQNLIWACHDDHAWLEAHPAEGRALGWRVPRGTDPAGVPALLWGWAGRGWYRLGEAGEYLAADGPG